MKRCVFRLATAQGGFVRPTLVPLGEAHPTRFGFSHGLLVTAILVALASVTNAFLRH